MGKVFLNPKLALDSTPVVSALIARNTKPSIVLSGDSKLLAINGIAKVMLEGLGMEADEIEGLLNGEKSFSDSLASPRYKSSIVKLYTQASIIKRKVLEERGSSDFEGARSVDIAETKVSDDAEPAPREGLKTANSDKLALRFKCDATQEVLARVRLKIDIPSTLSERGMYVLEFAKGK